MLGLKIKDKPGIIMFDEDLYRVRFKDNTLFILHRKGNDIACAVPVSNLEYIAPALGNSSIEDSYATKRSAPEWVSTNSINS